MNTWQMWSVGILVFLFFFNFLTWFSCWEDGGDPNSTIVFFVLSQVSFIAVVLFLGTALS